MKRIAVITTAGALALTSAGVVGASTAGFWTKGADSYKCIGTTKNVLCENGKYQIVINSESVSLLHKTGAHSTKVLFGCYVKLSPSDCLDFRR